jgi:four helix bundle suffix protein
MQESCVAVANEVEKVGLTIHSVQIDSLQRLKRWRMDLHGPYGRHGLTVKRNGLYGRNGQDGCMDGTGLIPKHGGFRKLKCFQLAQLCYDLTVRFCGRYLDVRDRTYDQMVQAARSGTRNISEGSEASGTSKKTELKLTNVAWASLGELHDDYQDFLRHRGFKVWDENDSRRQELVDRRCETVEDVSDWIKVLHKRSRNSGGRETYSELAANSALVLIGVTRALLNRLKEAQAKAFVEEGGFTERLYKVRSAARDSGRGDNRRRP